ncbi:hypothetical protein JCM11641_007016 [Rhodosporidiobolus odoratus]
MAWTSGHQSRGSYSALPSSPALRSHSPSPSTSSTHSHPRTRARTQRHTLILVLLTATLLGSVLLVPHETLPSSVQQAVNKGKEAYESAKAGLVASSSWPLRWEQVGVEQGDQGVPAAKVDPWVVDAIVEGEEKEKEKHVEEGLDKVVEVDGEQELDHGVVMPLSEAGEESEAAEETETTWEPPIEEVEEEVAIVCSSELREAMNRPAFWVVKETAPLTYRISARETLDDEVSSVCLSQAVFTARLVSPPASAASTKDPQAQQTLISLPPPSLSDGLSTYSFTIPANLSIPRGTYELDIRLDFGLYVGVLEGTFCGEEARSCDPLKLSDREGDELRYVGDTVEVQSGKTVTLGQETLAMTDSTPLCNDLSALSGYWSSLTFYPTSPAPCSLATPSFPIPFASAPVGSEAPIWIHFVGDSNTRNLFTRFEASLGNGRKIKTEITDSPTHNGTTATIAFRWASGEVPIGEPAASSPDLLVTWSWWYQLAPPSSATMPPSTASTDEEREAEFNSTVAANRDDLVRLVNGTLSEYLSYSQLSESLSLYPSLRHLASTLRPSRTYLSLGSHGEELTIPGVAASLDQLFSPSSGLSRTVRDEANLRFFTTALVNTRYIPLARFPHQDLVRTNALIHAKNTYAASRTEVGRVRVGDASGEGEGEGRVIDIEGLTRGIVEQDGWMKEGKKGPDAVHFREEVYDEWVRVVWTDLVQGIGAARGEEEGEEKGMVSVEEARRRWKRRIAWIGDGEEEEEEN